MSQSLLGTAFNEEHWIAGLKCRSCVKSANYAPKDRGGSLAVHVHGLDEDGAFSCDDVVIAEKEMRVARVPLKS